ncbi:MAG: chemotaxis protein CheB [Bacteroidota bacterium]
MKVITGSDNDGTKGIKRIQECGGLTIIQDPKTAEFAYMAASAIIAIKPDCILPLEDILSY